MLCFCSDAGTWICQVSQDLCCSDVGLAEREVDCAQLIEEARNVVECYGNCAGLRFSTKGEVLIHTMLLIC